MYHQSLKYGKSTLDNTQAKTALGSVKSGKSHRDGC
jgi:hypothetical protein